MIDASLYAFLVFSVCIFVATVAGLFLSRAMPWTDDARQTGLARAVGVALGPFLFGIASVLALGVFRGAAHSTHLVVVLVVLVVIAAAAYRISSGARGLQSSPWQRLDRAEWPVVVAILFSVIALLFISLFVPLTQNDALEYALAARELYATRDLLTYPVLNPETNLTGFFGPWTHPPLYVAMLYMAEVIQGHADSPGLIRLVSPWFMLCGAIVTYALGSFVNRSVGLLACLLFLSPPLFFLGAGSALLDSLPILGFTLILAAVTGLNARPAVFGSVIGVLLGLALWTHSQAILFVPLALAAVGIQLGARDWRSVAVATVSLICAASMVGAWPYLRNIVLFGSPVSDNPAVFAMPKLHWDDYFSINRGLNNPTAMLQYGILKGWFAIESYGLIYWGMTIGAIIFLVREKSSSFKDCLVKGLRSISRSQSVLCLMLSLISIYLIGLITSVAIGIDHMVKNERYLLVTLPIAVVFCACGYVWLLSLTSRKSRAPSRFLFYGQIFISAVAILQISFFTFYISISNGLKDGGIFASLEEKLFSTAQFSSINFINQTASENDFIFTMRPADMYYSKNRMISYLQPETVELYEIDSAENAIAWLLRRGVRYLHVADYGLPPLYNSLIYSLIRDETLTSLVYSTSDSQIYELKQDAIDIVERQNLLERPYPLNQEKFFVIGGRKGFGNIKLSSTPLEGFSSRGGLPLGLFHRNIASSIIIYKNDFRQTENGELDTDDEYGLDFTLRGVGLVRLFANITFFNSQINEEVISQRKLVTFELSEKQPERAYGLRFGGLNGAVEMSIEIDHVGTSNVEVLKAELIRYKRQQP